MFSLKRTVFLASLLLCTNSSYGQVNNFGGQPSPQPGLNPAPAPGPAPFGPATLDPATVDAFAAGGNFGNQGSSFTDFGATRDSFSSSPTIMGDLIGGQVTGFGGAMTVTRNFDSVGTILSGSPGGANSTLGFDIIPTNGSQDVFSTGTGRNVGGGTNVNQFDITEPLPGSDAPGSPGAGFTFSGGTATLDGGGQPGGIYFDGDNWMLAYTYTGPVGSGDSSELATVAPGPGVAVRRIKISENYSPDVRDRLYLNYSFFNDVQGGLGDISRVIMGMERVLIEDLASVEFRLPVAGTFGNRQVIGEPERRALEIGDASIVAKGILLRTNNWLWSGGLGFSIPLAADTSLSSAQGEELLRVENETFHIQPFTGLLYRYSDDFAIQTLFQMDFAVGGDPVFGNLDGGRLPELGEFSDSTLASLDLAATRTLYRGDRDAMLQAAFGNLELHYTATTESSDFVQSGSLNYGNLADNFNILNLTTGAHFVFNNDLVLSPAVSVPLRDGTDEQFDYEGIVQLNYYR